MGGVAVCDLRQMAGSCRIEMRQEGLEESRPRLVTYRWIAATDAHPGFDERSDQPGPDGALVVGAIARRDPAAVAAHVSGFFARRRSTSTWRPVGGVAADTRTA